MFCRFCGGQIPDEAVFCPDCGKQLCTDTKPKQTARQRQSVSESFRTGYQKGKQIGESVVGGQNQAKKSAVRGTAAVAAGGTAAKAGTGAGAKLVFGVLAMTMVLSVVCAPGKVVADGINGTGRH